MSLQETAIHELGETIIDQVFNYMQKNDKRFSCIPFEQQIEIVSISLTGANISITKIMKEKIQ